MEAVGGLCAVQGLCFTSHFLPGMVEIPHHSLQEEYEGSFVPVRGFHSFTYCRTTESGSTDAMTSDTPRRDLREERIRSASN